MKRIIIMRHAQSEENMKYEHLSKGLGRLRRLRLPTMTQVYDSVSLLQMNLDANVSSLGKRQIHDVKTFLDESNFWDTFDPQLLLHSNLHRTKETLRGVIPVSQMSKFESKIVELSALHELFPLEYLWSKTLYDRQQRFLQYLDTSPAERILIAGHGRYLKLLLKESHELRNCDMIEVNYQPSSVPNQTGSFDLSSIKRYYRSPLSTAHPSEAIPVDRASNPRLGTEQEGLADVVNDLQGEDEPTCRICQMTLSEMPTMRLIRPCKCSGSLSYVHLDCLNRWRATSITAQYTCTVCKYQYRFERTLLASFLTSNRGILVITILILLAFVIIVGYIIDRLCIQFQLQHSPYHPVTLFYRASQLRPWWRICQELYTLYADPATTPTYLVNLRDYIYNTAWNQPTFRDRMIFCYDVAGDSGVHLALFCYPRILAYTRILENGLISVSGIGFLVFFLHEAFHRRFREYGAFFGYCILTARQPQMGRLAVGLGCLITGYHLYHFMWIYGQKIGTYLGEKILEPNH